MSEILESAETVASLSLDAFRSRLQDAGIGIRIGPFNAHLRVNVADLEVPLHRLYADYPLLEPQAIHSFHARLAERRGTPRVYRSLVRFTVDGRKPHEDMPAAQALPVLEWGLNLVVALRSHCFLMLHAAVLERDGIALLLPASPGDGKTTLCAGLSQRGWRTLSDEFGLARPGSIEMIPVPRPMALKNESIEIVRAFAPDAVIGPSTPNTRKGTVAHLKPTLQSIARQSETAPAKLIVFPRWKEGAAYSLQRISKAEGFMFLATNAFNYELLGEAGFDTVRQIIEGADCYRLQYSDLQEAVHNLTSLVAKYAV